MLYSIYLCAIKITNVIIHLTLCMALNAIQSTQSLSIPFNKTKYLNIPCDFTLPGGGCFLRESYCSFNVCICQPDFPINVEDLMCIQKHKKVGEICTFDGECDENAYCKNSDNNNDLKLLKKCLCRAGYEFSLKSGSCKKGFKGAQCTSNLNCDSQFVCTSGACQCDFGFGWHSVDETCYNKVRFGDKCEFTMNCWLYDRLSECDPMTKKCVCRKQSSQRYVVGQLTKRCETCVLERYDNETDTCMPETLEVEYMSNERSTLINKYSIQYVYIALSMTPFVVFAAIGFFYKYFNSSNMRQLHLVVSNHNESHLRRAFSDSECHNPSIYTMANCNGNVTLNITPTFNDDLPTSCLPPSFPIAMSRQPPPTYEESLELPPSYEEAVGTPNHS